MRKFLVGIDGTYTPDPDYWRARNEFIVADSAEEAIKIWSYLRGEWLREDEIPYIKIVEVPVEESYGAAYRYKFTETGFADCE